MQAFFILNYCINCYIKYINSYNMRSKNSVHNVYNTLGASNHTNKDRSKLDFYATPPLATKKLLELEEFSNNIWEPACGMNHITKELEIFGVYNVKTSDINDMIGDGSVELIDFLNYNGKFDGDIITNPLYKFAQEFVEKAIDTITEGHKVAMFLKLQFLEGKRRKQLFDKYPPKIVYISSSRLGCSETGNFNDDGNIGSAIAYCWYIWEKGYNGDTILKWF